MKTRVLFRQPGSSVRERRALVFMLALRASERGDRPVSDRSVQAVAQRMGEDQKDAHPAARFAGAVG